MLAAIRLLMLDDIIDTIYNKTIDTNTIANDGNRQAGQQAGRPAGRQASRQTSRQAGRQAGRQARSWCGLWSVLGTDLRIQNGIQAHVGRISHKA